MIGRSQKTRNIIHILNDMYHVAMNVSSTIEMLCLITCELQLPLVQSEFI